MELLERLPFLRKVERSVRLVLYPSLALPDSPWTADVLIDGQGFFIKGDPLSPGKSCESEDGVGDFESHAVFFGYALGFEVGVSGFLNSPLVSFQVRFGL